MTTVPKCKLIPLVPLVLIVACGTESNRSVTGILAASHTANFSPWSEPVSLGPTINTSFDDRQPAVSKDGLSLYFGSNRPESPDDVVLDFNIWVSRRACADDSCPWETPVLASALNTSFTDGTPTLSRDGHWLFLISNRPGGFGSMDLWVSWRENVHDDFAWGSPTNLGPGVNTSGFEGGPFYFVNEDVGVPQLYFNRNPLQVNTGGDIYVSEQAPDGSFGTAVPVPELSSAATDQRPVIAHNGLDIYFYSDRQGSILGSNGLPTFDIWVATRENVLEPWSAPTNLGPPINTAVGELIPFIFSHGATEKLYFTRNVAIPPAMNFDIFVSTRVREGSPE